MRKIKSTFIISILLLLSIALDAKSKTEKVEYLGISSHEEKTFTINRDGKSVEIKRVMTSCAKNKGYIQPFVPVKGVTLVNELDMLKALNNKNVLVVDMREEEWFLDETIPTAINIPYTEVEMRLDELGCEKNGENWSCANAKTIYSFCNGPVCLQSPIAIKAMVRNGYPADKIFYYRGGMLVWDALGLTTVKGEF